jgi:starvation-inducible outer membrane lipoprotein
LQDYKARGWHNHKREGTTYESEQTAKILVLMMCAMLTACTTVQPWERGNLAKPQMALDPYPLQSALRAHNYGSREAAAGGNAAQGGRLWVLLIN